MVLHTNSVRSQFPSESYADISVRVVLTMKLSGTKSVDNLRAYRRPLDDCKNAQTSAAPMADGRAPPPSEGRGFPAHRQQHASALHGGRQDHLPQGRVCRAGDRSSPVSFLNRAMALFLRQLHVFSGGV